MFTTREFFCGNCGCKNRGILEKNKMKFICKNDSCGVSILTTFKSDVDVVSNYRYHDGETRKFTGVYCENCQQKHNGFLDEKGEFKVKCECGYSILVKKQSNGDYKVTEKLFI